MMRYQCKCGDAVYHTTMGVPSCARCGKCGSDIAPGPNAHRPPQPHRFVKRYDQMTGAPHEECETCHVSRAELEGRGEIDTPAVLS